MIEPREAYPDGTIENKKETRQKPEEEEEPFQQVTAMRPPLSNVVPVGVKMLFTPQPIPIPPIASTSAVLLSIPEGTPARSSEEKSLLEMLTILNNNEYAMEGVF